MTNLDLRQRLAVIAVLVWLTTDLFVAVASALKIAALGGTGAIWSPSVLAAVDHLSEGAGVACALALIASVVLVGRWIYRANANAQALSDAMTVSPGWAVGYFFVPIASLFKPFEAIRQTWQVSVSPDDPDSVPVPAAMRWWWGLWLLSNLLGNVNFRRSLSARTASDLSFDAWLDIATFVIDVPMTLLLIAIMRRLTANQRSIVDPRIFE